MILAGINDQLEHAKQLIRLLSDIRAKVNLIPLILSKYFLPTLRQATIDYFRETLMKAGINAITRKTRGEKLTPLANS